jgi:hypothetical protein
MSSSEMDFLYPPVAPMKYSLRPPILYFRLLDSELTDSSVNLSIAIDPPFFRMLLAD